MKDFKVIPRELQHRLVVVDVKKENLFKCMKMRQNMQWRLQKLKEKKKREKFKDKVKQLVNTKAKNLWGSVKDGVLEACENTCGWRKRRRKRGSTWLWNEKVQAIKRKKERIREMCKIQSEESKNNYKREKSNKKNCQ